MFRLESDFSSIFLRRDCLSAASVKRGDQPRVVRAAQRRPFPPRVRQRGMKDLQGRKLVPKNVFIEFRRRQRQAEGISSLPICILVEKRTSEASEQTSAATVDQEKLWGKSSSPIGSSSLSLTPLSIDNNKHRCAAADEKRKAKARRRRRPQEGFVSFPSMGGQLIDHSSSSASSFLVSSASPLSTPLIEDSWWGENRPRWTDGNDLQVIVGRRKGPADWHCQSFLAK